jgi:hypothetical protein
MISTGVLVLSVLAAVWPQTAPDSDEIRQRVQAVMDEKFKGMSLDRRLKYTEAIIGSLSSASSPERSATLLKELPGVVDYFASGALLQQIMAPKLDLDASTQVEAYDIQASYLSAIVARAASARWTEESKSDVLKQIESVASAGKAALAEKISGDGASDVIDRTVDQNRRIWIATLESPFSCFIDRPLTPDQLEKVLQGIRTSVSEALPTVLARGDIDDPQKLANAGITEMIEKVRAASWKARGLCFAEMEAFERRSKEYQAKLEGRMAEHYREAGDDYVKDANAKLPPPTLKKPAGAAGRVDPAVPSDPPEVKQSGSATPIDSGDRLPRSKSTLRTMLFLIMLVAVAALILWSMRGRKALPRP